MRYLLIAFCIFLAVNVFADQSKPAEDASGDSTAVASEAAPSFAGADSVPSFSDDNSGEPSYDDAEEPSFGDEGDAESE
ncbi:MAG: hypothetical protein PHT32_00915 [Candidatus Omnitrophica bacterium]|nr:hypothetical protein [Candidatus Omnitrophota bacterium]